MDNNIVGAVAVFLLGAAISFINYKLTELIMSGGKNKYRSTYLKLASDTLVDFAKMLRRLKHIACLIKIAAHTHRAIISILAFSTLLEITAGDGTYPPCHLGIKPYIMQCISMAITKHNSGESRAWIILTIRRQTQ